MISIDRVRTKLNSIWLGARYPFCSFGKGVSIHFTCEIHRSVAKRISFGDDVWLAADVWVNVVEDGASRDEPAIIFESGCKIGRRSIISANNSIHIEHDVMLAPSVLIMDHNHEYSNPNVPISSQGTTRGGRIVIERNCWIGHGAVILCGSGDLIIGHNSVIGANAVVKHSIPPCSVVAGNPARLIKTYDPASRRWRRVSETAQCDDSAESVHAETNDLRRRTENR